MHCWLIREMTSSSVLSTACERMRSMQRRCKISTWGSSGGAAAEGRADAPAAGPMPGASDRITPAAASQHNRLRLMAAVVGLRGQKGRRRPVFML